MSTDATPTAGTAAAPHRRPVSEPQHTHTALCGSRDRIVVGIDGTDESTAALKWAAQEAQIRRTHLHVVYCAPEDDTDPEAVVDRTIRESFTTLPVDIESLVLPDHAAESLVAASHGAALLVVGAHDHGPFGRVFRSVARRTAAHAACPVAVVRKGQEDPQHAHETIAVAVDNSRSARDALWWAADEVLHRQDVGLGHQTLRIVHAQPPDNAVPADREAAHTPPAPQDGMRPPERLVEFLCQEVLVDQFATIAVEPRFHVYPDPVTGSGALFADVSRDADLLVIGSSAHRTISSIMFGTTLDRAMQAAACPLVIMPTAPEDRENDIRDAERAVEQEWTHGRGAVRWTPSP